MAGGVETVINFWPSVSPASANVSLYHGGRPSGSVVKYVTGRFDSNWAFDGWTVSAHGDGGQWVVSGGDITTLYSASSNQDGSGGEITFYNQPAEDIEHDDVLLDVVAVWRWVGSGSEPTTPLDRVTVTVVSSSVSGGTGTVAGDGVYPVGASYTVSGTPSENPRSVVTRMSSSLGADISYRNQLGDGTRSETATATQDVTWTVEFARAYVVSAYYVPTGGGGASVPYTINCSPTVSGHYGTTTLPDGTGTKSGWLFVAGAASDPNTECTIDVNPSGSGGNVAQVLRFRTDTGLNYDGQTQATFQVSSDTEFIIYCAYYLISLGTAVYTDNELDSSGGTITLSDDTAVQAGDQITVTATATAGTTVRPDGTGEDHFELDYLKTYNPPDTTTSQTHARSPVTVTILGRNLRNLTAGFSTAPAWMGIASQASESDPEIYFETDQTLFAVGYFKTVRKDYEFEIYFTFKTYASHGAVGIAGGSEITSGQKIKKSTQTIYVNFGSSTNYPVVDVDFFLYGLVQTNSTGSVRVPIYSYPARGGVQLDYVSVAFTVNDQVDRGKYYFDVWIWPRTTGKILYRQSDGEILRGTGGSPMAQFVDVQQQGA